MSQITYVKAFCECGEAIMFHSVQDGGVPDESHDISTVSGEILHGIEDPVAHCMCGNWNAVDLATRSVCVVPPPPQNGPLVIRMDDGKVLDTKRMVSEGGGMFMPYHGDKKMCQFDRDYFTMGKGDQ
ncbi:hypothetical protein [Kordiimonas sp.]|uniref:hypothetical protein n=1 Tax=Kordiimonas sp. TaxID=1970157 RepID=UPI003A92F21B